jgi:hypothetical protein
MGTFEAAVALACLADSLGVSFPDQLAAPRSTLGIQQAHLGVTFSVRTPAA